MPSSEAWRRSSHAGDFYKQQFTKLQRYKCVGHNESGTFWFRDNFNKLVALKK